MRIALFCDTFPPIINGVSRTLGRLLAHAQARGHEVAVMTPKPGEDLKGPEASAALAGAPDLEVRIPAVRFPLYPEMGVPRPLREAEYAEIEAFDPDLVHVPTESVTGWFGRRWALRNEVPLVTSFHTMFPDYLPNYRLGFMRRPIWRYLRSFHDPAVLSFAPSTDTLRVLEARGFHDRFHIWSRGVDSSHFRPDRKREEVRRALAPGAERIVLYVGRVAPEKKIDVVIEAFRRMQPHFEVPTALVVVGDGPARERLERAAPPNVRFAGYRTGEPLADAYAAGDVFVFASDTETFGNVVAEAQASGLPAVVATRGGQTDIVTHEETGLLAAPNDPAAFAEATLRILRDDDLRERLSRTARERALERSWPAILDGVLDAYEGVLAGFSAPTRAPSAIRQTQPTIALR